MKTVLPLLLALLALAACGRDDSKTKLYEQERAVLDKAKAVDSTVQSQVQAVQQSINKQSGEAAGQ